MSGVRTILPWRYLVPRPRYFQSLKIAKACPEIRWHINRNALLTAGFGAGVSIALPFLCLGLALEWLADLLKKPIRLIPDFEGMRIETTREAHSILPVDEIRERIGLPVARIITKAKPLRTLSEQEGRDDE